LTGSPPNSDISVQRSMNNELVRSCAGKGEGVKKNIPGLIFLCIPHLGGQGGTQDGTQTQKRG